VREFLGHRDVSTTMISIHVLNRGGSGVQSPAERTHGTEEVLPSRPCVVSQPHETHPRSRNR
jgi:hypothetical protein